MIRRLSLSQRLALVFTSLLLLCAIAVCLIQLYSSAQYGNVMVQRLSAGLAQQIAAREPLLDAQGQVDRQMLKPLFDRLMTFNPSVELYLLSPDGELLADAAPPGHIKRQRIDLAPVQTFLSGGAWPVYGDDPRSLDKQKVFSVAPRRQDGQLRGYLYIILQGETFNELAASAWQKTLGSLLIWTLLLGLLGVHLMETVRKKQKLWVSLPVCAAVAAAGALLGTLGMTDYYGAGVLTVFAFYIFRGRKWWCLLGQVLTLYWINVVLLGGLMYPIRLFGMEFELCQQGLALLALVPIWLYRGRQGCHSKPFQYACYAFYPVHMLLLVLALNFVNR